MATIKELKKLGVKFQKRQDGEILLMSVPKTWTGVFEVPNGVTIIHFGAFVGCQAEEIIMSNSVTEIGGCVFEHCENLKKVTFSNNLKSIQEWCFSDCKNLQKVIIPESVERIEGFAFCNCENLQKVIISKNLKYIDKNAFYKCKALKEIITDDDHFDENLREYKNEPWFKLLKNTKVYVPKTNLNSIKEDSNKGEKKEFMKHLKEKVDEFYKNQR